MSKSVKKTSPPRGADTKKTASKRTIVCGRGSSAKKSHSCAGSSLSAGPERGQAARDLAGRFVITMGNHSAGVKRPVKQPAAIESALEEAGTQIGKSLWDALDEIWATVPDDELRKLPTDLAAQHDHYIYGLPKKVR